MLKMLGLAFGAERLHEYESLEGKHRKMKMKGYEVSKPIIPYQL